MRGRRPGTQLVLLLLAIAGVVVVIMALVASGGDLLSEITVRGGTVPALLVMVVGVMVCGGGISTLLWSRRE
jgi:hypothetical protein